MVLSHIAALIVQIQHHFQKLPVRLLVHVRQDVIQDQMVDDSTGKTC